MTYDQALTDAEEMALFCAGPLQTYAGAVSPRLVWEGAQKSGLTTEDLAAMCSRAPDKVAALQWL